MLKYAQLCAVGAVVFLRWLQLELQLYRINQIIGPKSMAERVGNVSDLLLYEKKDMFPVLRFITPRHFPDGIRLQA